MSTAAIRRVSVYSGLNFNEVLKLPYAYFLLLNKESWIDSYMKTKEGQEILKNLWRLQQTGADLQAVHDYQKRGVAHGREH